MTQSEFLWQSMLLKPAWVEETCLLFSSCLWVSSHTLPPCVENESWIPIWFVVFFLFSLCYYRYKGFKGNCSFSFIEQFRALHQCNEYCEMLGLKSLRTTHQKQRKATPTKSKNLPNSSTVKKMVPKKTREPRDFISSEHWGSLSHLVKLLLRTWSSDTHQWPEGITSVFCLLTLFWNHPDADASNQGRSWSSALGAWDLTLGQGFGNKLSHLLDFLTGFCRLALEKNISVSTSTALWFSCYGNINIFKMPSTRFAQYCICICVLG